MNAAIEVVLARGPVRGHGIILLDLSLHAPFHVVTAGDLCHADIEGVCVSVLVPSSFRRPDVIESAMLNRGKIDLLQTAGEAAREAKASSYRSPDECLPASTGCSRPER